jgi:hypothetical protein
VALAPAVALANPLDCRRGHGPTRASDTIVVAEALSSVPAVIVTSDGRDLRVLLADQLDAAGVVVDV